MLGGEDTLDFVIATRTVHCPILKVPRLGADFLYEGIFRPKMFYPFSSLKFESSTSVLTKLGGVYLAYDIPASLVQQTSLASS